MEWIKINEQLPYKGQRIIFLEDGNNIGVGVYGKDYNNVIDMFCSVVNASISITVKLEDVTHWMPLPNSPINH